MTTLPLRILLFQNIGLLFALLLICIQPSAKAAEQTHTGPQVTWKADSATAFQVIVRDREGRVVKRLNSASPPHPTESPASLLQGWDGVADDGMKVATEGGGVTAEVTVTPSIPLSSEATQGNRIIDFGLFKFHFSPWKIIGLTGACLFGCRWLVQLWATKNAGKSTIPFSFWIMSIVGSGLTLAYYLFGKNDSVGIINNLPPFLVAAANIYVELKRGWRKSEPKGSA